MPRFSEPVKQDLSKPVLSDTMRAREMEWLKYKLNDLRMETLGPDAQRILDKAIESASFFSANYED